MPFFINKEMLLCFIKNNLLKIILGVIIIVLAAVMGISSALSEPVFDVYEGGKNLICLYFRSEKSLFAVLALNILETAVFAAVIFFMSFNAVLSYFSFAVVFYKSFTGFYTVAVVVCCKGLGALIFAILQTVWLLCFLLSLILFICYLSEQRGCNVCPLGLKETAFCSVPFFILLFLLCIVQSLFLLISGIFI